MATPEPDAHLFRSPKRKRGTTDSIQYSPVVSPSLTRIATEYPFQRNNAAGETLDRTGDDSPRSMVAGQLNELDLRQDVSMDNGHTSKRLAYRGNGDRRGPAEHQFLPQQVHEMPTTSAQVAQATQPHEMMPAVVPDISASVSTAFTFEVVEPASVIVERPRMHNRSPPLDGDPEDNPMTWHDSEITGHNPSDPDDDGYGINGIGFKPTAAMAWARSQRRKQQLSEYKSREAKEARQRRSERRRMEVEEASAEESSGNAKRKAVGVRFEDV